MASDSPIPPSEDWLEPLESLESRPDSFVVVIRWNSNPDGKWRGAVEHIQSHERMNFRDLARLTEFIAAHSGIASVPPPWWRRLASRWRQSKLFHLFLRCDIFHGRLRSRAA